MAMERGGEFFQATSSVPVGHFLLQNFVSEARRVRMYQKYTMGVLLITA